MDTPPAQESRVQAPDDAPPVNTNLPPDIQLTTVRQLGNGVYLIAGTVTDENPGGLTVTFGGVPSAVGKTAVTNDDGSFSCLITLRTDGSDQGNLTVTVVDDGGLSDDDFWYVNPFGSR